MTTQTDINFSLDLSDQVALVTGASSGIGDRFARVLAKCGAKVIIAARRFDRLASLANEINKEGGICEPLELDMTDRDSIQNAVIEAKKHFGTINTLVNNAGVNNGGLATKQPYSEIDPVISTNLTGPYVLCCEIARDLIKEKKPGRIINVSSMMAFAVEHPGSAIYTTSKGGMVRLTEALAVEWATKGINVNCIAPGAVDTEMMDKVFETTGDFTELLPRKRMMVPDQLDSVLLFLVSPSSDCVTGAVIKIDDAQSPR
ncbi:SDR family oxidoreductase [Gammaproteobacteria bacterium]|jgi:NAD(P)-dependent dehydrogenase (short-subunit alcohol dehydrogenase family)|nr:SDR family oxidoreductase [Gammaproteobacteria bacterium]